VTPKLYFVLSTPRSRSTWLANFLTFGPSVCLHDASANVSTMAQLRAYLSQVEAEYVGVVDTVLGLKAREFLIEFNAEPVALVMRPVREAANALETAMGIPHDHALSTVQDLATGMGYVGVEAPGRTLALTHGEVTTWGGARHLVNHLMPGVPFPERRFAELRDVRVTPMYTRP
jgi:hypothetical protein